MNKQEFLDRLREGLSGLPEGDIEERLAFYGEMIDDRMEDGLPEEEAVAGIGPADAAAAQIIGDYPLAKLVRERVRPKRRLRAWEIVLLVLGSPVWLPLLIAAFAVLLSVYIVLWALIVSLWAVELSLIVGAIGFPLVGIALICRGEGQKGLLHIAAGVVLAGLSVFLFFGCRGASKGAVRLTGKIAAGIRTGLLRKGDSI